MAVLAQAPSAYFLTQLTLRSMIELERARVGMDYETDVLEQLSSALAGSSDVAAAPASFQFIDPCLYEPYERLVRHFDEAKPELNRIQAYIQTLSKDLSKVVEGDSAPVPTLIPICVALHQELVQEINAEDNLAVNDWPGAGEGAQAGVRAS